ncbi:Putative transposase [Lactiplantibacillus plantarum subsp. plantarum P-8]|nr:Putative transposase [Lactiplantibacillus plantarum subsp. plantarum P-8]
MTTPKRYELEDAQWDRIKGYFPPYRTGRPSSLDNRTALNAILWLMRSAGLLGVIYLNAMALGKRCIVASEPG